MRPYIFNDPPAGYTLWVELPAMVDSMVLFDACKALGITVGPGQLFCASHRYRHCLRLSFAGLWGAVEQAALLEVGRQACLLLAAQTEQAADAVDASRMDFMCMNDVSAYDLW